MRVKMSSTSCRTRISGWMRPSGSSRPGSVTSTAPAGGRVAAIEARRSSMAASISLLRALTSAPNSRFASGASVPSCLSSPVTLPDFRLRNSSWSAFSPASARTSASRTRNSARSRSMVDRSVRGSGIRLGRKRGLGLRRYLGECCGLRGGHVRQHLAVERVAGRLEAPYQLRVGDAVLARRRVDADDPQPPEIALLVLAADVSVLRRGVDRFLRCAIQLALGLIKALGTRQQLLPLGPAYCSSFDSRHDVLSAIGCARRRLEKDPATSLQVASTN